MAETTEHSNNSTLPQDLLTIREVARILRVHTNTVRRWSDRGVLKAYRIGHRRDRRFSAMEVSEFLKANLDTQMRDNETSGY